MTERVFDSANVAAGLEQGRLASVRAYPFDPDSRWAVVVTFNPDVELADNLTALKEQIPNIILVDNASEPVARAFVEEAARRLNLHWISNITNDGIAKALNQGAQYAVAHGAVWLATFDQDSRVIPGTMDALERALSGHPQIQNVALISPVHFDKISGRPLVDGESRENAPVYANVKTVITSGNLISLRVWAEVGRFDEGLFIDYVDHDYCFRCRKHGYIILQASAATLLHSLGRSRSHWFFSYPIVATHHSAVRRYYISRNRMIVWWRHGAFDIRWLLSDAKSLLLEMFLIVSVERDKMKKVIATIRGFRDALVGKRGGQKV